MKRYVEHIEIIIEGHIERDWFEWFSGIRMQTNPDGTTVIHGVVRDQSELFGIISSLKNLGLRIIKLESSNEEIQEESNEKQVE